jgi:hypothetical protein
LLWYRKNISHFLLLDKLMLKSIKNYQQKTYQFFQLHKKAIILFTFSAIILTLITPLNRGDHAATLLAKELLSGRPYLPYQMPWLETLELNGHWYIAYPPMVTFLVLPYIILGGQNLGTAVINSLMLFGASIFLYLFIKELDGIKQWAFLAVIAYLIGTTNLHSAHIGSIWLLMHSQGNFFLLLSLFLFCSKRQYFWAGLSFAIAFQVRYLILGAILVFPLYAIYCFRSMPTPLQWRNCIVGILPPCLLAWAFQWWTLGDPFTSPYTIAWKQWEMPDTLFSISYLPQKFQLYFFGMPKFLDHFPYLRFEFDGQAMWVLSPFLLGILFMNFRRRFVWALLPSTILMLVAYLCYWHTGYSQYGTRYVQDIFPLLIPLAFAGFSREKLWIQQLLPITIILSCLINIYAVFFALRLNWS